MVLKYSFSSEEDVYELINKLDIIHEGKLSGNDDMLLTYVMFDELVETVQEPQYINEMRNIIIGSKPLSVEDYDSTVEEVCADRLNISLEEFNEKLHHNVQEIVWNSKGKWLMFVNSRYPDGYFDEVKDAKEWKPEDILNCQKGIIPSQKRVNMIKELSEEDEKTLSGLVEYQKEVSNIINSEEEGENGLSDRRLAKLSALNIELVKDINTIRRSYGEVINSQFRNPARSMVSYDVQIGEISITHNKLNENQQEDQAQEIEKIELVKKVKEAAKEKLTTRQYIIFQLYFLNDMTQQETADIMDVSQQYIAKAGKTIINNLKKKLENRL